MLLNFFTNLAEGKIIDVQILPLLISGAKHNMKAYDYRHTSIRECDICIHLDYINPIGLNKAPTNILITSYVPKIDNLRNYLNKIDHVLCKTREAENYFSSIKSEYKFKLKYLGWTMFDKLNNQEFHPKSEKSYYTIINNDTDLDFLMGLLNNWQLEKPLKIYSILSNADRSLVLDLVTHPNVDYYEKQLPDNQKDSIFIHLNKQPFDYELLSEASTGSILISKNDEMITSAKCQYIYHDLESLQKCLKRVDKLGDISKASQSSRDIFMDNQKDFLTAYTQIFIKIFQTEMDKLVESDEVSENTKVLEKPLVSAITPTYDRPWLFRIAKYVWNSLTYENREWIIIDDSPEPMTDLPDNANIKYIYRGPLRMTIGQKRNLAIELSKGDFIMCLDDDDFYPPDTIEKRLEFFDRFRNLDCSYASTIACYDIYRKYSFINTPSIYDPPHKRVSEATLFFRRAFWERRGFPENITLGEGEAFIEGRYDECLEVDWRGSIISLLHQSNISGKRTLGNNYQSQDEPNGNHFMNDEWGMREDFAKLLEERQ